MSDSNIPSPFVLIVGAGPVGLALAIELGLRDIDCVLVEQRDGKLRVPRMSQVSGRNMEFCRRWGIADKVRNAVWSSTHPLDFVYAASLVGEEVARVKVPSYQTRGNLTYSPEGTCTCPQIYFDPILAEKAQSLPKAVLRYNTRLEFFEQDRDKVRATVTDRATGEQETITVPYMVACDGAGGQVRETLGIPLEGKGTLATSVNVFFRAPDLISLHDKGWARFYRFVDEESCWSELIAIDGKEYWRLTVFDDPNPDLSGDSYLHRMMDGQEFEYEIIDTSPWDRRDYVARSYGEGRVLIAGDAAHQCSPTGGLGMHTGVCEAVNLAWKFEALAKGWGGDRLIASYQPECRPIAAEYVEISTASYDALTSLPPASAFRESFKLTPEMTRTLSVPDQLRCQFCYEDSPICVPEGTPPLTREDRLEPRARSGMRAPHCWIGEDRSTLDLFGDGFVLLRIRAAGMDVSPLEDAAAARGLPLTVIDLDEKNVADLYERNLVLVRPDAHIAWRSDRLPDDPLALIDRVRGA